MKIIQGTALIILLLFNSSLLAADWMVGGSLGVAWGDADSVTLNNELVDRGINASVSGIDNSRMTGQLFFGYEYMPRWGVELGYVDLGDVEASISGTLTGINDYFTIGQDIYPQTATGWQLSSIYRYPVSGKFQWTGRVGVYNWTTDYTLNTATASQKVSEDGIDILFGIGMEIGSWIKHGGIVSQVNWDRYKVNDEAIDVLGFGVSYRF